MRRTLVFLCVLAIAIAAIGAETKKSGQVANEKKPAAKDATPKKDSPQPAKDDKGNDLDLNGVWKGWVVEGKGENPNRGSTHMELTIKGNQIVGKRLDGDGGPLGQGTYTITTERFYMIDATETGKRGKPKVYPGIVRFGPDLMKWCVATPGNNRPTDFETKGNQFLLILKRQRP